MARFVKVMNAKEFDSFVLPSLFGLGPQAARYWDDDRYLSGYVHICTRIGTFIRKNKASRRNEVIKICHYGYELFFEPKSKITWRKHRRGHHYLDLSFTLALAANAKPSLGQERFFYGRVKFDGFDYYGQVREDGKCYFAIYMPSMQTEIALPSTEFEIMECMTVKSEF